MEKEYLGDGVYIQHDDQTGQLVLTAENGVCVMNIIYLEPEVMDRLLDYHKRTIELCKRLNAEQQGTVEQSTNGSH